MNPLRRPFSRDDLGVEVELLRATVAAREVELGWTALRIEMREMGWPSRTPEGDRTPTLGDVDGSALDYADPTGELAMRFDDLTGDLEALQDHWHLVQVSLDAIRRIAHRHMPSALPAVPACSVTTCDNTVERKFLNGGIIYLDMEQIAGMWVARPGAWPTCAQHRRRRVA